MVFAAVVGEAVAVGVVEVEDGDRLVAVVRPRTGRARHPGRGPAERCGSTGPCRRTSTASLRCWPARTCVTPAAGDLVDDRQRHARRGGADDDVDVLREETVGGLVGLVGRGVARVALDAHDVLAEHATVLVDLLDGQVEPGELRRSEEGQRTRLRQQRAERQHAVAGAVALDRGTSGRRRSGPPSPAMYCGLARCRCGCCRPSSAGRSWPRSARRCRRTSAGRRHRRSRCRCRLR